MNFRERVQATINRGLQSSQELFDKAKEKAKDLGEKGVLKFEITQLDSQIEKLFAKLGTAAYRRLVEEGHNTLSQNTPDVKELLERIKEIQDRIEEKEKLLGEMD